MHPARTWNSFHTAGSNYRSSSLAAANSNALEGIGAPSNPGWESGRLNRLTEWADASAPNRPIICEYNPKGMWLWRRWRGTVLKASWRAVVSIMFAALSLDFIARDYRLPYPFSWDIVAIPGETTPFIKRLAAVTKVWEYQLTLSTFILTFFLSHAFSYWQKVYNTTRMIQGRINDVAMLITMAAERGVDDDNNETGKKARSNASTVDKGSQGFSKRAEDLVTLCMRYIRLSHTFFWAQTATSSNGLNDSEEYLKDASECHIPIDDDHIGPLLLSPYGLKALERVNQLSKEEKDGLMGSCLPPSQYAYILLVWVGVHAMEGLKNGTLRGGAGFEENLYRQLATLRACMFDIDDFRAGRMPLAYVQLVQVLVDSLLVISPFALYPSVGILSVPLVGLLALFFRGLLQLSKSFLDPFGVEGFQAQCLHGEWHFVARLDNIEFFVILHHYLLSSLMQTNTFLSLSALVSIYAVDVLVSELNFGTTRRWINAGSFVPTPPSA